MATGHRIQVRAGTTSVAKTWRLSSSSAARRPGRPGRSRALAHAIIDTAECESVPQHILARRVDHAARPLPAVYVQSL